MSEDPVIRSDDLDRRMNEVGIPSTLDGLRRFVAQQRRTSRVVVTLVILMAFVITATTLLAYRANQAAEKATRAQSATVSNCNVSNQARSTEQTLWDYILSLPPTNTEVRTPAQQKAYDAQVQQFKQFLATNLAQRDCTKLTAASK